MAENLSLGRFGDVRLDKGGYVCSNAWLCAKVRVFAVSVKAAERGRWGLGAFWPTAG